MKILLTGASGRLGQSLFTSFVEAGHCVRGTDLEAMSDPPAEFIQADLLDGKAVEAMITDCDAVVHVGNHPNADIGLPLTRLYLENITMNTNVFHAAVDAGVQSVVFASSIQVIAGDRRSDKAQEPSCVQSLPLNGHTQPCPGNEYALSKLAGENMLQLLAQQYPEQSFTAVRLPLLVKSDGATSPGTRKPGRTGHYTLADMGFAYLTMQDAASLILSVLDKSLPGYHQYLPSAGNNLGLPVEEIIRRFYPDAQLARPIHEMQTLVDISQIRDDLGWQPREVDIFATPQETV